MTDHDKAPDTVEVLSSDIIAHSTDAERADLYKHMAFEADRRVKELEAYVAAANRAGIAAASRVLELKEALRLACKADDELAHWQRSIGDGARFHCASLISNARAALCKAKEVL